MLDVPTNQSPYPSKPYESMADVVADKGRYGDSMMMHVSPAEVAAVDSMVPGGLPRNPETGQPEAFLFSLLGALLTKGAAGSAGRGTAGTFGGALSTAAAAVPKFLGSGLTSLSQGLTAAGVPFQQIPGFVTNAVPGLAQVGSTAGNPILQGIGQVGSNLGQIAGLPVEAAGKVLGTHQGGGGLGEFFGGSPSPGGGPPGADTGFSDAITKTGEMSQNVPSPADLAGDVIKEGSNSFPSGEMSQNVGQQIKDMGSQVAKETGRNVSVDPGSTTADGGGFFADMDTGDLIGAGLLGTAFLDYVIPPEDDDPYGGGSSYEGESSWSGRTYSGGTGGGRSGERSYYTGRVG